MNTPDSLSDSDINNLVEFYAMPQNTPRVMAQIDPDIAVADFARALAAGGYCIRANAESPHLYITRLGNTTAVTVEQSRSGKWFWVDDLCEEPMGPFDTEGEARADYWALRVGGSERARHDLLDQGLEP